MLNFLILFIDIFASVFKSNYSSEMILYARNFNAHLGKVYISVEIVLYSKTKLKPNAYNATILLYIFTNLQILYFLSPPCAEMAKLPGERLVERSISGSTKSLSESPLNKLMESISGQRIGSPTLWRYALTPHTIYICSW